jgi:CRISPR-associated protein Cmr6
MTPVAQQAPSGKPATPLLDSLPRAENTPLAGDDISRYVPREYRAQALGRCQRQYTKSPDLNLWIKEWVDGANRRSLFTAAGLHTVEVQIDWRLMSNSGVDEGIIRPVIGAGGWPLIPGSGIKGLFRRACPAARLQRWCGSPCQGGSGELSPGLLRFHGAWPTDVGWSSGLLDIAHSQQNWQVINTSPTSRSAVSVVSLYKPCLQVGLSSTDPSLTAEEWEEIDYTLRLALQQGIGARTCVGYGSSGSVDSDVIFQCGLSGQGPAAKLLDGTFEFRPTMFRAAIRGMALRLFGGISDGNTAMAAVDRLFGSINGPEGQNVGLLATAYTVDRAELGQFRERGQQQIYATEGFLQWRLMRACRSGENEQLLSDLLEALHGLTMSLGGFGRGWRRPDHRIFDPNYPKFPLGCHWQWREPDKLPRWVDVQSGEDLSRLLQRSRELAEAWLKATGQRPGNPAGWREVIHPDRMRVWWRIASDAEHAELVHWFHDRRMLKLKGTALGGKMSQVGRLWNRLLPLRSTDTNAQAAAPIARSASSKIRPAALARGAVMARPGAARQQAASSREVWIHDVHRGSFLETVVLFPDQWEAPAFIDSMNRGEGSQAGFRSVRF